MDHGLRNNTSQNFENCMHGINKCYAMALDIKNDDQQFQSKYEIYNTAMPLILEAQAILRKFQDELSQTESMTADANYQLTSEDISKCETYLNLADSVIITQPEKLLEMIRHLQKCCAVLRKPGVMH